MSFPRPGLPKPPQGPFRQRPLPALLTPTMLATEVEGVRGCRCFRQGWPTGWVSWAYRCPYPPPRVAQLNPVLGGRSTETIRNVLWGIVLLSLYSASGSEVGWAIATNKATTYLVQFRHGTPSAPGPDAAICSKYPRLMGGPKLQIGTGAGGTTPSHTYPTCVVTEFVLRALRPDPILQITVGGPKPPSVRPMSPAFVRGSDLSRILRVPILRIGRGFHVLFGHGLERSEQCDAAHREIEIVAELHVVPKP